LATGRNHNLTKHKPGFTANTHYIVEVNVDLLNAKNHALIEKNYAFISAVLLAMCCRPSFRWQLPLDVRQNLKISGSGKIFWVPKGVSDTTPAKRFISALSWSFDAVL
jgi:hypothetical protein